MQHIASQDRPREKLGRVGAGALGDNELLAILIGHGTPGTDALDVANAVLAAAGGLLGLTRLQQDELTRVPGVGATLAARIHAAVELGRRAIATQPGQRPRFRTPSELAVFLLPQFGSCGVERFGVVLLDARHRLIRTKILSTGSLDASVAHPREVYREAMLGGAAAVVAFHNHPSGDPLPTEEDMALTRRLASAGRVVGIDFVDHVILADMRYCSMREAGTI